MNSDFTYLIPSKSNINNIVGLEIKNIIKYSFETYDEFIEYLNDVGINKFHNKESFFKYSYGALLIVFNDCELSFVSAEDLNSLIVCYEKDTKNIINEKSLLKDEDVLNKTSILELDAHTDLINQKVVSIDILTRNDLSPKERGLPSEVGLRFNLTNQKSFIISHNLTQNSFVFSILFKNDTLPDSVIIKLTHSV